jgi:acyl-coenzyme A synthetase/AMP-(fatty) acid ligase
MAPTRPATLRAALQGAALHTGQAFTDDRDRIPLEAIASSTSLDGDAALRGRAVMLACSDQLTAALALVSLDGVAARILLCPPDLSTEHRRVLAAHAGVEFVVADAAADVAGPGLPIAACSRRIRPLDMGDEGEALPTEWLLATSGTSGVPKLVQHDLAGLTAAIASGPAAAGTVWGTFYDIRRYGGLQIFLRAILGGASLVLSRAGEAVADHLARLGAAGVTHLTGTPSHWRGVLMSPAADRVAPRYVRLSGEIADQAVLDALAARYPGAAIGHAYASTEAGVGFEVNDGLAGFPDAYLGTRGDVAMAVVDGALRVRSSRAARRYVGPDIPALADSDGFVDTGDMVERRGDRWHFVGRRNGIINVGGLKVHPEEVEAAINRHAGVRMSLVHARKNPITGALVVADVVMQPDAPADATTRAEILGQCRASLASHKVPVSIRFVPALATTAAGKLARHG